MIPFHHRCLVPSKTNYGHQIMQHATRSKIHHNHSTSTPAPPHDPSRAHAPPAHRDPRRPHHETRTPGPTMRDSDLPAAPRRHIPSCPKISPFDILRSLKLCQCMFATLSVGHPICGCSLHLPPDTSPTSPGISPTTAERAQVCSEKQVECVLFPLFRKHMKPPRRLGQALQWLCGSVQGLHHQCQHGCD